MIPPSEEKEMVAKMHRMHLPKVGEGVIYVPGGVPYEADATQQYALGSFMRIGNKEFVYARAGNTLKTDRGAKNSLTQLVGFSSLAVKIVKGDLSVSLTCDEEMVANYLQGGEIVVFGPDEATFTRGIISHPKVTDADYLLVVALDSPAPKDIALTEHAECMASPYYAVSEENNGWHPVMGIPTCEATEGQFLWLQVSGPSWLSPLMGAAGAGGTVDYTEVIFRSDGSISVPHDDFKNCQHAGAVLSDGGATQGAPFIMLQIAH